jgi:hypothetical protein
MKKRAIFLNSWFKTNPIIEKQYGSETNDYTAI